MPRKRLDMSFKCDRLVARQQPFRGACRCCPTIILNRGSCQDDRGINAVKFHPHLPDKSPKLCKPARNALRKRACANGEAQRVVSVRAVQARNGSYDHGICDIETNGGSGKYAEIFGFFAVGDLGYTALFVAQSFRGNIPEILRHKSEGVSQQTFRTGGIYGTLFRQAPLRACRFSIIP